MRRVKNILPQGQYRYWTGLLALLAAALPWAAMAQSTNAPMNQAGPDLLVWYKADSATNCNTANCAITAWVNSKAATFPAAGTGTAYSLVKYGYNPAITSNSGGDFLALTRPVGNSMGFFVVFASTDSSDLSANWYAQPSIFSCETTAGGNKDYGLTFNDGEFHWSHNNSDAVAITSGAATNYADGLPRIIYVDRNGGNANMYINGASIGNSNSFETGNLNSASALTMFRQPQVGAGHLLGDIPEFLCYQVQLSTNERQRTETYLALRYGITLAHDYLNSGGTVIYPMTGHPYVNNVAGIGVQNNGRLNQRQSISSNPQGIVAIGNGTLMSSNKLNLTNFTGDNSYLIWGDNNGSNCWGNNIRVNGAEGLHLKIERNWRMGKTNPNFLVNSELELNPSDPDFPISLPTNSDSIIYLYLDTDDLFFNGGVLAKPMTFTGGVWKVPVTQAELSTYNYFSFGTKLDAALSNQTQCAGVDFSIYGSYLAGPSSCAQINIVGPQTFNLLQGPTTSDTTFYVVNNGAGECLDTLMLNLTGVSGVYDVFSVRDSLSATCSSVVPPGPARPYFALQQVTLVAGVSVDAGFDGGTTIESEFACVGTPNLLITTNVGSVIYSLYSSSSLININQLVQPGTDQIMVHNGTAGTHRILVTSSTNCGSDTLDVTVQQNVPSSFSYMYNPICLNLLDSISSVTPPGGRFILTAPGTGITVDTFSGRINTAGGTPGTYVITYENSDSTCLIPSTATVTVPATDQQIFSYPSTSYCSSDQNVLPIVSQYSQYPNGHYMVASVMGSGTMQVDSSNGALLFNTVTAGDVFTIRFENSSVPCGLDHDVVVTVWDPVPFNFDYPSDTLCSSSTSIVPTISGGVTNMVWTYDTANIDLDITTGAINPQTSTPGGPYVIALQGRFGANNCISRQTDTIWIDGGAATMIAYADSVYCRQTDADPVPLFFSGVAGGTFSSTTGLIFANATTGQIDLSATPANTPSTYYDIQYTTPNQTCPQTIPVANNILLLDRPNASFTVPTSVCRSNGTMAITPAVPSSGGYTFYFGANLVATSNSDVVSLPSLPQDGTYKLEKILTVSGVCSDTAFEFFEILRLENPAFAYSTTTVCESNSFIDPFISGDGGGIFTFDPGTNGATVVNDSSGRIDLDASNPGNHEIVYTTTGPCPDSSRVVMTILQGYLSDFSLALSVVCESLDSIQMDTVFNMLPSVTRFYSVPLGLSIDPLTGTIFPGQSNLSGLTNYQIIHVTGGAGLCSDSTFASFSIQEYDSALAIDYGVGPFCTADGVLEPLVTAADTSNINFNQPVGLTYSDTAGFGAVDLRYTRPGSYLIRMSVNGVCGETTSDSLTVLQSDDANFFYGLNGICKSTSGSILPTVILPGGAFTGVPVQSGDILVMNGADGAIDVGLSSEGTYIITYQTNGICPTSFTDNVTINSQPVITDTSITPGQSICENTAVEFSASGQGGSFSWHRINSPNPSTLLGIGAVIRDSTIQNGDSIALVISSPTTGCADTNYFEFEVLQPPVVSVTETPGLLDGSGPFSVMLSINQDGAWIQWWETTSLGRLIRPDSVTDTLTVNDVAAITNILDLDSDYDPAIVTLIYQGVRNGCRGTIDTLTFPVNPNQGQFFIAEVMTPNGDGRNDKWEIRYDAALTATDYYIEVYNRSGGKVYTVKDLDEEWYGDKLGDGVYWWMMYARTGGILQSGGLTIRRN